MQDTLTLDDETMDEEIDYDSFISAESDRDEESTGLAKLIRASDPENSDHEQSPEAEFVFEATMLRGEEDMEIVATEEDLDFMMSWVGEDSDSTDISRLAGKTFPVNVTKNGEYSLCKFPSLREKGIDVSRIKQLESDGAIEFADGSWRMSNAWADHNRKISRIQSLLALGSMSSAAFGLYAVLFQSFSLFFLLISLWLVMMWVERRLESKKNYNPLSSLVRESRSSGETR